jgi:hypothetical protein
MLGQIENGHWTELPELSGLGEIDGIGRLTDRKCLGWYEGWASKDAVVGCPCGSGFHRALLSGDEASPWMQKGGEYTASPGQEKRRTVHMNKEPKVW